MSSDRQKYNFLAAWCKQLDQATDEGDDLAVHVATFVKDVMEKDYRELNERLDSYAQWLAELQSSLEELDPDGGEGSGEEPDSYDDGDDDDDDAIRDEPQVERVRRADGRMAEVLGRTRDGQVVRRPLKKVLGRAQKG